MAMCLKCGAQAADEAAICNECGCAIRTNIVGSGGDTYCVVLEGKCLEGFDPTSVQANLSRMTKRSESATALLFSGHETNVKTGIDKVSAERYLKALLGIGVACHLEPETLEFDSIPESAIPLSIPAPMPSKISDTPPTPAMPPSRPAQIPTAEKTPSVEQGSSIERLLAAVTRNRILGLIVGWVFGVLFLLAGVISFFDIFKSGFLVAFSSLLLIIGALVLLPPARTYTYKKTGITIPPWLRIVLFFVVLFSFGSIQDSIEERAFAKRVQFIEGLIGQGRGDEALKTISELESSKVSRHPVQKFESLRIKARAEIEKKHCNATAMDELKSLTDSNDLLGLATLSSRCGKYVDTIAPALEKKRIEDKSRVEIFLKNVFKEGEIFSETEFASMLKNQLPGAIERPLGAGIYWVSIGNEFAKIETQRESGYPLPRIKLASVARKSKMPEEASTYTSISFDTTEADLTKRFPEVSCSSMPNPEFRMCSIDMEKADSITFLYGYGKLVNINGRGRPDLSR